MLIGELAKKTELSKDTIRFYEKLGLVAPSQQKAENGYKQYDEMTVKRLILIKQAKALGFTLREINEGISGWQNGELSQAEKIQILQTKVEQVEEKIEQLDNIKLYLMTKLDKVRENTL